MRVAIIKGVGFGLTSGIITTLGMIVGLNSGTHTDSVVLGGILLIAISDALSDAVGVNFSEEAENQHTTKEIWESTIATFLSKFIFALTFVVPILLFELPIAILVCIIWGVLLIIISSYYLAKREKSRPAKVITRHLIIAACVIIATQLVGDLISKIS